jgi:glutamate synthase (NADPH) small chain
VVVGCGNMAFHSATLAARRGAQDVYLAYRRSYAQMPAWPNQRDEALRAGVHLLVLCEPVGYATDSAGRLAGVRLARTALGQADASGRRRPVRVAGSEFVLEADLAIEAIGERVDPCLAAALPGVKMTDDGLVQVDPRTQATSRPGVWAAGDLTNGGATVVQALAEGKRAAQSVHHQLAENLEKKS